MFEVATAELCRMAGIDLPRDFRPRDNLQQGAELARALREAGRIHSYSSGDATKGYHAVVFVLKKGSDVWCHDYHSQGSTEADARFDALCLALLGSAARDGGGV